MQTKAKINRKKGFVMKIQGILLRLPGHGSISGSYWKTMTLIVWMRLSTDFWSDWISPDFRKHV